jgi:hypothetical protein
MILRNCLGSLNVSRVMTTLMNRPDGGWWWSCGGTC